MTNDLRKFIEDFNLANNALDMRTLKRWNGRDLLHEENLSEHTHLVIVYSILLYDYVKDIVKVDFEKLIRLACIHDSLEILRGDILSVTKNVIPGLRKFVEEEEKQFTNSIVKGISTLEEDLVEVADNFACYKFIELEYNRPHNAFTEDVYKSTKKIAFDKLQNFYDKYRKNK